MTALLIGATALGALVVGWYGYKAFHRIQTWGRNMDECDRIFQEAAAEDGRWGVQAGKERTRGGISLVPSLKTPHRSA